MCDSSRRDSKNLTVFSLSDKFSHEYHIWLVSTLLAVFTNILLFTVLILLFALESNDNLIFIRLIVGVAVIGNIILLYIIYQEMISRRRYLLEIQKFMRDGVSFLDSIRRGFKDMFGG